MFIPCTHKSRTSKGKVECGNSAIFFLRISLSETGKKSPAAHQLWGSSNEYKICALCQEHKEYILSKQNKFLVYEKLTEEECEAWRRVLEVIDS
jgi:hypothetical protein